jgi:formylglycine-generating enzyme
MSKNIFLFIVIALFIQQTVLAQTLDISILPKNVRELLKDFVSVPEAEFTQGFYTGSDSLQLHTASKKFVKSYYINRFEVGNGDFRAFYTATGLNIDRPDSVIWETEFPHYYGEPYIENYLSHPSYLEYPVSCVTWEQAFRYCEWQTKEVNALLKNTDYEVVIRLPTEAEWERAALPKSHDDAPNFKPMRKSVFPWGSTFFGRSKNKGELKFMCNSGPTLTKTDYCLMNYADDGYEFTAPVNAFPPNELGLYHIAGNVAEWTSDFYRVDTAVVNKIRQGFHNIYYMQNTKRSLFTLCFPPDKYNDFMIVKGGSWADEPFYQQCGVRKIQHPKTASATIGFRPVCIVRKKT